MRAHLWLKAIGTPVGIFAFMALYLVLLKNPVFPVTEMPVTILDHVVGFFPPALLLYVTLWLYVSIPPTLLATRRELVVYAWAIGGLCVVGLAVFLFWPTTVPPLGFDRGRHPGFDILQGVDLSGNACPSLHAAAAIFSAIWLHVLLRELGAGWAVRAGNWVWGLGIVYSAMATKQHVAVDVVAGVALGVAAAVLGVRRGIAHVHPSPEPVEPAATRADRVNPRPRPRHPLDATRRKEPIVTPGGDRRW